MNSIQELYLKELGVEVDQYKRTYNLITDIITSKMTHNLDKNKMFAGVKQSEIEMYCD